MVGVVADDLTGAAELAAVGGRFGLLAEVLVGATPGIPAATDADLVCCDTDSRFCSAEEAARRSAAAAAWLRQAGAQLMYKKVDSVLRGQVTAEALAVMRELKLDSVLLAPTNPGLGRTIQEGRYFVHCQPIDQTEFATDPEYPRLCANVLELIAHPEKVSICVCRVGDALPAQGIIICEAANRDDLAGWAARGDSHRLLAGGAEFFAAVLAGSLASRSVAPGCRGANEIPNKSSERELFVCGSVSESTRTFVEAARRRNTPIFGLPVELSRGGDFTPGAAVALAQDVHQAFEIHTRVILRIGLPLVTERTIARMLVGYLAQVAELVLRRTDIARIYVEGGATAAELVGRMGWHRLVLVQELAPGVVTLAPEGTHERVLTLKPGSYCWPDKIQIGR